MKFTTRGRVLIAAVAALAVVAAACGGSDEGGSGGGSNNNPEDARTPVSGGSVVYALENESFGGYCLPEAQLAISGIQVAKTIYDTLFAPNADGEYVPFLAESAEPNEDSTVWTIKLREGVTFHDGTPLTAEVVKNNIDAYRGQYPARTPQLFIFVFSNIASVDVVDDLTVTVTTTTPWAALPAALYGSGRVGIMAQAQLDDASTCDSNLIGTGPFKLDEWLVNDKLTASKNEDYWQKDADGVQLPYLDSIEYRPIIDESARLNALEAGDIQALHTNDGATIEPIVVGAEGGTLNAYQSDEFSEVSYIMFNTSKAPFDSLTARQAVTSALNTAEYNTVVGLDQFNLASGPFAPGSMGYLEDTGYPEFDVDEAEKLAAQYESESGEPLTFTMTSTNAPSTIRAVSLIQEQMSKAGIEMNVNPIEQSQQINTALGNDWQAQLWRNHPGGDPDTQYNWWYGGSPVNFNKFDDPEVNDLLDRGRTTTDPAERQTIYEDLNELFAAKLYNSWINWSNWTIGTSPDVFGVFGPDLPDGSAPFTGLVTGNPVSGMWVQQ